MLLTAPIAVRRLCAVYAANTVDRGGVINQYLMVVQDLALHMHTHTHTHTHIWAHKHTRYMLTFIHVKGVCIQSINGALYSVNTCHLHV